VEFEGATFPLPYCIIGAAPIAGIQPNQYGQVNVDSTNITFNKAGLYHCRIYMDS